MTCVNIIKVMIFSALMTYSTTASPSNYVQDACSVTTYRDICIHSLASFSNTTKRSPSKWARAGVSVTIVQAKSVMRYLTNLRQHTRLRGRNRIAISDCVECFQYALDELHKSLYILRKLSASGFDKQMSDLTTFMSTALTYADTCLDGFEDERVKQVDLVRNQVMNTTYFTSNALALVNKLAITGVRSKAN